MSEAINEKDFLNGQRDCEKGVAHKSGMSESYDRGYAAQYEMEQILSVETMLRRIK